VITDPDADESTLFTDAQALMDDAHWARFAKRLWVTPQAFLNWWVARRFVVPRDIRRR
jgi:hypothetical protein